MCCALVEITKFISAGLMAVKERVLRKIADHESASLDVLSPSLYPPPAHSLFARWNK
jgi:hypothetical protein